MTYQHVDIFSLKLQYDMLINVLSADEQYQRKYLSEDDFDIEVRDEIAEDLSFLLEVLHNHPEKSKAFDNKHIEWAQKISRIFSELSGPEHAEFWAFGSSKYDKYWNKIKDLAAKIKEHDKSV